MIKTVERENLIECISVIRDSFKTVADDFGNCRRKYSIKKLVYRL